MVFDHGLVDYKLFGDLMIEGVYFVTRLKDNTNFRIVKRLPVPGSRNILRDGIIQFTVFMCPGTVFIC